MNSITECATFEVLAKQHWCRVLGLTTYESVSFFDVGGDSMRAVEFIGDLLNLVEEPFDFTAFLGSGRLEDLLAAATASRVRTEQAVGSASTALGSMLSNRPFPHVDEGSKILSTALSKKGNGL